MIMVAVIFSLGRRCCHNIFGGVVAVLPSLVVIACVSSFSVRSSSCVRQDAVSFLLKRRLDSAIVVDEYALPLSTVHEMLKPTCLKSFHRFLPLTKHADMTLAWVVVRVSVGVNESPHFRLLRYALLHLLACSCARKGFALYIGISMYVALHGSQLSFYPISLQTINIVLIFASRFCKSACRD